MTALYTQNRCWLCGDRLGKYAAFMGEPLVSVTRVSHTPPAHHDCAKFAAQTGIMLPRDAKVVLVWVTRSHRMQRTGAGHVFAVGEAEQSFWYSTGRSATRDEVHVAVSGAVQELYANARSGGKDAVIQLDLQLARATRQFPPHATLATGT